MLKFPARNSGPRPALLTVASLTAQGHVSRLPRESFLTTAVSEESLPNLKTKFGLLRGCVVAASVEEKSRHRQLHFRKPLFSCTVTKDVPGIRRLLAPRMSISQSAPGAPIACSQMGFFTSLSGWGVNPTPRDLPKHISTSYSLASSRHFLDASSYPSASIS